MTLAMMTGEEDRRGLRLGFEVYSICGGKRSERRTIALPSFIADLQPLLIIFYCGTGISIILPFQVFIREEMAIDEAELEPAEFAEKMDHQQKLQEQQLEMLKFIRKFHPDDQSAILGTLHEQMESANFDNCAAFLTTDEIQEIVRRRSTPREPNASC